jgi:uncharacterized protein (TIGR03437 family)
MTTFLRCALLCVFAIVCPLAGATSVLDVSSSQFTFGVAPGANPPPQSFRIVNRGDGTLNPTVAVPATFPWLSVTLANGSGTLSGNIAITSSALAAGVYNGTFTLSDPAAADSPRVMSVTLYVTTRLITIPSALSVYVVPNTPTFRDIYLPLQSVPTGNIPAFQGSTQSGGNWLATQLIAESGVYVRASIGAVQEGSYSGAVSFVLRGATVGQVPIALTATSRAIISLSQASVSVETSPGREAPDQLVQVSNQGLSVLNWAPSSDSPWMTAVQDGAFLHISFSTGSLAPGVYQGNVTITSNTAANAPVTIPVTLKMIATGAPAVKFGGAVDAANYCIRANCYLAPGSLATLFGTQLANQTAAATTTPLPNKLSTTQVLVNGTPVSLIYVSYGQVNFQLPAAPPPGARWIITVQRDGQTSNVISARYTSSAPAIFTEDQSGLGYGAILLAGQAVVADSNHPATRGAYVEIYGTGLGTANTPAPTVVFSGTGITGNIEVPVSYAGPAPGFAGLNQINVQIPTTVPATSHLRVQVRTAYNLLSNVVEIAVK